LFTQGGFNRMAINRQLKRSQLSRALLVSFLMLSSGTLFAQDGQSSGDQDAGDEEVSASAGTSGPATTLDKVQVVGSRIKRAQIESSTPVTIISRAELDREGHVSVSDMLQTLTQGTTGSFTGDLAVSGFTPNAQVVNLRALGPGYTLTLVNGRRPPMYPQPYNRDNNITNVRAIPTAIVDRTEVLTGGASAIYGSDAVAGVVNIVTRKNFDGNTLRGTVGTTAEGGGDYFNLELSGGRTGDRWSWLYALSTSHVEPIFASQREMTADMRNNPYGLTVNPALSIVAIDGLGWAAGTAGHNAVYDPGICEALGFTTVTTASRGRYCGSFDQVASRSLQNSREEYSAYTYGTFDVTDNTQLFASLMVYKQDAKSSSGTEFWGTSGDRFTTDPTGATTTYFYEPNIGTLLQLQRIFQPRELGGNEAAATLYTEKTWYAEFGAQGSLGRFDWEASINYGEYDYKADRPRLLAKAVHDYFLGPLQGYLSGYPIFELNLDTWNAPLTPEIYRSFSTRVVNESKTSSGTINFNITGDLFNLPAGPVSFAGVLEANRQTLDLRSDWRLNQLLPPSENTIYNLTSSGNTSGERDLYSAGVEFRIPVFSMLTTTLAARYDKYDDISNVDDAVTWNAGFEFRPFSNLLIRGNYATSFRAPDLQLVYAEGSAAYSSIFDEYACRSGEGLGQTTGPRSVSECGASSDPTRYQTQSRVAGNPLLKEEEGESWSVGFVWDIIDGMTLTADYYEIVLEDKSTVLSAAYILQNEANCRLGVHRDGRPFEHDINSAFCQSILGMVTRRNAPDTAAHLQIENINTSFINASYQRVTGVDASFAYRWNTDRWGNFRAALGWTIELADEYQQLPESERIDYRDLWDYNSRSRTRMSLTWDKDEWSATVFGTRWGSVVNWDETDRLKPFFLWNLGISRNFGPSMKATLQVNNVFDNKYRLDPTYTSYPYFYNYHGADIAGRRFYVTLQYKF